MKKLRENEISEIAILFKKKLFDNNEDRFELIPVELLYGYYNSDHQLFVDCDGKAYPHFISDNEKYVFGFNKSIVEYVEDYIENYGEGSLTYVELEEKILEDVFSKKYLCDFESSTNYLVNVKEKGKGNKSYYMSDYICDFYNGYSLTNNVSNEEEEIPHVDTIKLYNTLKKHIIGQDEGLKTVVGTIWKNYNSNDKSTNIIIIGPPGVGKTETARIISEVIGVPITTVSANQFSQVGYVGDNTTDTLKKLLINAEGDVKRAERGIIVIDEIDKIAKNSGERHGVATEAVQNELLKLIEDGTFIVEGQEMKTKNITFIAFGAFDGINKGTKSIGINKEINAVDKKYNEITFEDLENYGLTSQLLGRFPVLVPYNNLSELDFKNIMTKSNSSVLLSLKKLYEAQGIELIFDDEIISLIAKRAIEIKHGVRGIETTLIKMMEDINFVISQNPGKYTKVITSPEMLNDCKKYILE